MILSFCTALKQKDTFFHKTQGKKCLLLLLLLNEKAYMLSLVCSVVTLFPAELSELNNDPLFPSVHCKLEILLELTLTVECNRMWS